MKKIILSLVAIFALGFVAQAQGGFGLTAGLNVATVTGDDVDVKSKIGGNVGALYEYNIGEGFNIQPEVRFSMQGLANEDNNDFKTNLNYVNIPVKLEYTATENLDLFVGPQVGFLIGAEATNGDNDADVKELFKGVDFGLLLGGEYVTDSGFGAGLGYNFGLSDILESNDAKAKNGVFNVNLIYMFNQ